MNNINEPHATALSSIRQQNAQQNLIPKEQLLQMANSGVLSHMGGKLYDGFKGLVTQAADLYKQVRGGNVIDINNTNNTAVQNNSVDTDKAYEALSGHESRGTLAPTASVSSAGAVGLSQLTPIMITRYNKLTGSNITPEQLNGNGQLQIQMTKTLIPDIMKGYSTGLVRDWPTGTDKLKQFKQEVKTKFNQPISWLAGEWVAGPNWVGKLDNKTAPGATETVRDYINKVTQLYNSVTANQ